MCTLALYFRTINGYPLIVAANRDEYLSRPSASPRVLGAVPRIVAGQDLSAGGTWLGFNEHGMIAAILNRPSGSEKEKGRSASVRSRGLLCLDLLNAKHAAHARALLQGHDGGRYRPFTLLIADPTEAFVAFNVSGEIRQLTLDDSLHVFSNTAVYNPRSEKIEHAYRLFSNLIDNFNNSKDSSAFVAPLREVLGDHAFDGNPRDRKDAICVHADSYGTVSSSIIFYSRRERRLESYYCPGAPCKTPLDKSLTLDVR